MRKERAESIKTDYQKTVPKVVSAQWAGKMLPGLNVGSSKEEQLQIIIPYRKKEELP